MDKNFHPLGISVCTDEKSADFEFIFASLNVGVDRCGYDALEHVDLMADASDAITNGFQRVLASEEDAEYKRGNYNIMRIMHKNAYTLLIGMCWFHMQKTAYEKLTMLGDSKLKYIQGDNFLIVDFKC